MIRHQLIEILKNYIGHLNSIVYMLENSFTSNGIIILNTITTISNLAEAIEEIKRQHNKEVE
jgi:hypothetical protein